MRCAAGAPRVGGSSLVTAADVARAVRRLSFRTRRQSNHAMSASDIDTEEVTHEFDELTALERLDAGTLTATGAAAHSA